MQLLSPRESFSHRAFPCPRLPGPRNQHGNSPLEACASRSGSVCARAWKASRTSGPPDRHRRLQAQRFATSSSRGRDPERAPWPSRSRPFGLSGMIRTIETRSRDAHYRRESRRLPGSMVRRVRKLLLKPVERHAVHCRPAEQIAAKTPRNRLFSVSPKTACLVTHLQE